MHVQMKFRKFEKMHILWNNFIKCAQIFFKPSEQMFYPDKSNEG